jgi:hypothetical protein
MVKGTEFVDTGLKAYEHRRAQTEQRLLAKLARRHGLQLTPVAA